MRILQNEGLIFSLVCNYKFEILTYWQLGYGFFRVQDDWFDKSYTVYLYPLFLTADGRSSFYFKWSLNHTYSTLLAETGFDATPSKYLVQKYVSWALQHFTVRVPTCQQNFKVKNTFTYSVLMQQGIESSVVQF